MPKRPLTIHVAPEAAEIYEAASNADREALDRMMGLQLKAFTSSAVPTSEGITDDATEEGITPQQSAPPRLDRAERLRRLRAIRGIWEGRTDLPTREEFREEWEERLKRFGLGD